MAGVITVVGFILSTSFSLFHFPHAVSQAHALVAPIIRKPEITVLFGGDMMFDRSIRIATEEKGGDFLFSCIDPTLEGADLVVANLEGPITENLSQSVGSAIGAPDNFTFTFPLSTAKLLYSHHIRIVNIGNNHILNFGNDGVRSTMSTLAEAGVGYFGDPLSSSSAAGSFNHVRLAFINYNEFVHRGEASTTIAHIQEARVAGQLPVVYTHWGIEYATTSPERIHTLAHQFVDAGAAIVIGSHPHVVEEHEVYKGVDIYYSLGNFIFDQYWNDDVRHGLLVQATFTASGVMSIKEIPIVLGSDRRTCPVE